MSFVGNILPGFSMEPNKIMGFLESIGVGTEKLQIIDFTKKLVINTLTEKMIENPSLIAEGDWFSYLKDLEFTKNDIRKLRNTTDNFLDKIALQKTGYRLDSDSKRILRNELIFSIFLVVTKG